MEECLVENKTAEEKRPSSILRLEASKNSQENGRMSEIVKSVMLERLRVIAAKEGITDIPNNFIRMVRSCDSCRKEVPFETWELYECFKIFCLCLNRVYGHGFKNFVNMDIRAMIFHILKRDNPDSTHYALKCRTCSSNYDLCYDCYSDMYHLPDLSMCPKGFGCHTNLARLELCHGPLKFIYQTNAPDEDLKRLQSKDGSDIVQRSSDLDSPFLQWHKCSLPEKKEETYESFGTSFFDIDNNSTVGPDEKALENMSKTNLSLSHGMVLDVGQGCENVPWRLLKDVWLMFRSHSSATIKYGTPSVVLDNGPRAFHYLYMRLLPVFEDFINCDDEKNQNKPLFLVFVYPNGDEFWIERSYYYQRGPIKTVFKTYFAENSKNNFSRYKNLELVFDIAQQMYIESLPGQFIWIGLCSSSPIISREITLLNMGLGNDEDIQEVHQDILDKLEARRLEFLEEYDQRDD